MNTRKFFATAFLVVLVLVIVVAALGEHNFKTITLFYVVPGLAILLVLRAMLALWRRRR